MKNHNPYKQVFRQFNRYWIGYGGWNALLTSPFFHLAFLCATITSVAGGAEYIVNMAPGTLASALGFTLGGYAIFIGFGDDDFKQAIAGTINGEESPLSKFNNSFFHFLTVQSIALIYLIVVSACHESKWMLNLSAQVGIQSFVVFVSAVLFFVGSILFFYAITLALASALAIHSLVVSYDQSHDSND